MACSEFEGRLLEYRELAPKERAKVDTHLAGCAGCRDFLEALEAVDVSLGAQLTRCRVSAGFEAAVYDRVRRQVAPRRPSFIPEILDFVGWGAVLTLIGLAVYWASVTIPAVRENAEAFANAPWAAATAFMAISFLVGLRSLAQMKR